MRWNDDERGSAMVISLVFLSVWGLVIFALLSFAEVGFRTSAVGARQTAALYTGEGAVEVAIAYLAADPGHDCEGTNVEVGLNLETIDAPGAVSCDLYPLPGDIRLVDLEARVQDTRQPVEIRARVRLDDSVPGSSEVTVVNWTVLR